jgi:hypothetical protein
VLEALKFSGAWAWDAGGGGVSLVVRVERWKWKRMWKLKESVSVGI